MNQPLEAECKFRVSHPSETRRRLTDLGANHETTEKHRDLYLRHPCRDFRQTDEALRIRQVNDDVLMTYKGPRLEGPIKIRPEIEIPLAEGTKAEWLQIWMHLGFEVVQEVCKTRQVYSLAWEGQRLTVTMDDVEQVGQYAEIERLLKDRSEIEIAQQQILEIARRLGLTDIERRSYLSMLQENTR